MAQKTVNARELILDVKSGMSFQEIRQRYGVSRDELDAFFSKLVSSGLVQTEELPDKPVSLLHSRTTPSVKCRNCGMLQIKGDKVCLDCGSPLTDDPASQDRDTSRADSAKNNKPGEPVAVEPWTCPGCGTPQPWKHEECPQCGIVVAIFERVKAREEREARIRQAEHEARERELLVSYEDLFRQFLDPSNTLTSLKRKTQWEKFLRRHVVVTGRVRDLRESLVKQWYLDMDLTDGTLVSLRIRGNSEKTHALALKTGDEVTARGSLRTMPSPKEKLQLDLIEICPGQTQGQRENGDRGNVGGSIEGAQKIPFRSAAARRVDRPSGSPNRRWAKVVVGVAVLVGVIGIWIHVQRSNEQRIRTERAREATRRTVQAAREREEAIQSLMSELPTCDYVISVLHRKSGRDASVSALKEWIGLPSYDSCYQYSNALPGVKLAVLCYPCANTDTGRPAVVEMIMGESSTIHIGYGCRCK